MSRAVSDALGYGLLAIALTGFGLMAVGFTRLFRQAWRSPNRREAIKKVLHVQPRKNAEWPNNTREADLIGCGAGFGAVLFIGLLILMWTVLRH